MFAISKKVNAKHVLLPFPPINMSKESILNQLAI